METGLDNKKLNAVEIWSLRVARSDKALKRPQTQQTGKPGKAVICQALWHSHKDLPS